MATIYEAPFVFGVRVEGDTFTDRREETERLKMNFLYGINTILISPRRMGKTSLVDKVCSLMVDDSIRIARMDAFGCRSEQDFINAFATAVLRATSSKWEEWMKEDILQLPELIAREKGIRIVVCIDEFQQLGEFPDSLTFQKKLRSVWQLQNHVSYCLYGSKKHLMEQMFQNASYPFYRFGDFFYLEKISEADWVAYITHRFKATGKEIASELATEICRVTERYSSYVQQLAWFVWLKTTHTATMEDVQFAINRLLDANEPLFIQQTEDLSAYQMNFLRAIVEGVHSGFTQTEVLNRYRLGTAAYVTRVKVCFIHKVESVYNPDVAGWLHPDAIRMSFHSPCSTYSGMRPL